MKNRTKVATYVLEIWMENDAEVPAVNDALDELQLGDKMRRSGAQVMAEVGGALAGCVIVARHDD